MKRLLQLLLLAILLMPISAHGQPDALPQPSVNLRSFRTLNGAAYVDSITVIIGRPADTTGMVLYHVWYKVSGGGDYSLFSSAYGDSLAVPAAVPGTYYVKVQAETISYVAGRRMVTLYDFDTAVVAAIDVNNYVNYFFNPATGKLRAGVAVVDSLYAGQVTTQYLNFVPLFSATDDTLAIIGSINASAEGIDIEADNLSISAATTFSSGYDPSEKAYADSVGALIDRLGLVGYEDEVGFALLDSTVIVGGVIKTSLLTADNIISGILTGLTMRTSASGQRVVIDGSDNTLRFYNNAGVEKAALTGTSAEGTFSVGTTGTDNYVEISSLSPNNLYVVGNAVMGTITRFKNAYASAGVAQVLAVTDADEDSLLWYVNDIGTMGMFGNITMAANSTVDGVDVSLLQPAVDFPGNSLKVLRVNSGETALEFAAPDAPAAHATTHQDGGSDEIDLTGLVASVPIPLDGTNDGNVIEATGGGTYSWQAPTLGTVTDVTGAAPITSTGGATPEIALTDVSGITGGVPVPADPAANEYLLKASGGTYSWAGSSTLFASQASFANHDTRHENGEADEINVGGLSGLLADAQTPKAHNQSATTITSGTLPIGRGGTGATGFTTGQFIEYYSSGPYLQSSGKTAASFEAAGGIATHAALTTGVHGLGTASQKDAGYFAIASHASGTTQYGAASTSTYGHVRIGTGITVSSGVISLTGISGTFQIDTGTVTVTNGLITAVP